MPETYDVIIIGAGHNGLTAAAYLAKAGKKVLVLERREIIGGTCVTEEAFPGFKVSTAAYVNSLFRPTIIRELELKKHGFEMLPRNPSSFTPFHDGRYLMMGPDAELNRKEVSKFSVKDAEALPRYEKMLERIADFIEPTLEETPPNPFSLHPKELWRLGQLGWRFRKLGKDAADAVDILTGSARIILDRWFESDELKATLATDGIIGAMASPSMPGTAYVLFHHVMGECNGVRGVWGYMRGGMGNITQALAASAKQFGAVIRTNAAVGKILVRGGAAAGVALQDGTEFQAKQVASNADCNVTFVKLMDAKDLPEDFLTHIKNIDYASASLKINVALSEVPDFKALPGNQPGPQHRGTVHLCPSLDFIEKAYDDCKYGKPSESPVLECTIPSSVDPTVAPPGKHLLSMFVQYAPYHLKEGNWDEIKDKFADRCFDMVNEYAPNFKQSVIDRQILTPLDLERRFALTGGNIFQGAMTLNQLAFLRPTAGWAGYKTPVRGLYLCGAAAHPGGGVMGACGYNAAREMLKDRV